MKPTLTLLLTLLLLALPACQTETRYVETRNGKAFNRNLPAGAMYNQNGTQMKSDLGLSGLRNNTSSHGFTSIPGGSFSPSALPKGYSPKNP